VKFLVTGEVTISCMIEVEAPTAKAARKIAADAGMMSLCASCSEGDEDCWSTNGEIDGVPTIIEVKKAAP
jgi:hypothetical protein